LSILKVSSALNAVSATPRSVLASRPRAAITISLVLTEGGIRLFLRGCSEPLRCAAAEPMTRLTRAGRW
jgi:hypothetical protein